MAGTQMTRRSMLGTVSAASLAPIVPIRPDLPEPHARPAFSGRLQVSGMPRIASATQAVAITGGTLRGRTLAGIVRAGQIRWQPQPGGGIAVSVCVDLCRADGAVVQVHERGLLAAGTEITQGASISAIAEVLAADGLPCELSSLLVGRIDTTRLHEGVVQLWAFEVS